MNASVVAPKQEPGPKKKAKKKEKAKAKAKGKASAGVAVYTPEIPCGIDALDSRWDPYHEEFGYALDGQPLE